MQRRTYKPTKHSFLVKIPHCGSLSSQDNDSFVHSFFNTLLLHSYFFFLANLNFILFFKYKFIYFNWRLITLQYCIGFAIHQHTTGIHVFPIPKPPLSTLPYHPSGSSQHTSPKQPVSCTKLGLVICFMYDIIHDSMSFSQIIPPLPLPQSPKDCSTALLLTAILSGSWGYMFE